MPRGPYKRIPLADRERIVRVANDGGNWRQLAQQLDVKYKTAYTWISAHAEHPRRKGGSVKKMTDGQVDNIVAMIEMDPSLTLKQLAERTEQELGVRVCKSSIHNYLEGRLITLKKVHVVPATMDTDANKQLRQ